MRFLFYFFEFLGNRLTIIITFSEYYWSYKTNVYCVAGWNDPPPLTAVSPTDYVSPKRVRTRVYHSIDGVGAAGQTSTRSEAPSLNGFGVSVPPLHTQPTSNQLILGETMPSPLQPTYQVSPAHPLPSGPQLLPTPLADGATTFSQLTAQINQVFGDTSIDVCLCLFVFC